MIRKATTSDLTSLIRLGERLRLESKVWFPPIDPEYFRAWAGKSLFSGDENYCCFVFEKGGNIVGWLNGAIAAPYEFNPMRVAVQRILYVVPECRGSTAAARLMKAFEEWADARGISRRLAGLGNGLPSAKVDRFYRGFGFEPIGGQYLRDAWASKQSSE